MAGSIKRFINVSTDEVYGETSLGKEIGGFRIFKAMCSDTMGKQTAGLVVELFRLPSLCFNLHWVDAYPVLLALW